MCAWRVSEGGRRESREREKERWVAPRAPLVACGREKEHTPLDRKTGAKTATPPFFLYKRTLVTETSACGAWRVGRGGERGCGEGGERTGRRGGRREREGRERPL